jgi:manganese transport protein
MTEEVEDQTLLHQDGNADRETLHDIETDQIVDLPLTWRQKIIGFFKFLGPAVLISVGYIDPGNWATDIQGNNNEYS